jgi:CheY-like chemotaxis protein
VHRKLGILWVEDDPNDVTLIQRAFQRFGIAPLHICCHGEDAVQYVNGDVPYSDRDQFPLPNVIMTDLSMPRLNGLELLRWLRADPRWQLLPIVIFSASAEQRDIQAAYGLGANAFFQKPMGLERLIAVIGKIFDYWAEALPPVMAQSASESTDYLGKSLRTKLDD